ncbi:unnamed protein product [Sphagnum balticum]
MECKEKEYRSFVHYSEAYYSKVIPPIPDTVDEVNFGLSCDGGGTHGEMTMIFTELGGKIVPQLRVFDDGWDVLLGFADVLAELSLVGAKHMGEPSITPKQFCEILLRCGFKDSTDRVGPQRAEEKSRTPSRSDYEQALRDIATLWPIGTSAKIIDVAGVNDGKSRAIIAETAVTIARKALGIERLP